jgi:LemA protein
MLRIVLIALAAALVLYVVWIFNRLIALRVRAGNAWSDIDVQLKRRWDLLPPLVETVRGYATHESRTLEETVAARSRAQQAERPAARAGAEAQVSRQVVQLFALAEAYPDLKASEMFRSLHDQLVEVEDHLQSARRYYNAVVRDYNTLLTQFPHRLAAAAFRFQPREFFELESAAEAAAPIVKLKEG